MRQIPCPLCGAPRSEPICSRSRGGAEYTVVRCSACGFHFVNPEPDPAALLSLYDQEYSAGHDLTWHGLEDELNYAVVDDLRRRGVESLVDLGAGQGRFVHLARTRGIDALGVEPSPVNCAAARERYGIDLVQQSVQEFLATRAAPTPREAGKAQCITMLNVLEHLPDPVGVLRGVAGRLQPGGTLALVVPNVDFTLALARVRGLARFRDVYMLESSRFTQQGFDPPIHLSSFDGTHLRAALDRAGMDVVTLRHAPVIRARNPVADLAKRAVAAAGRTLERITAGRVTWGYSLYAVAVRRTD